MRQRGFVTVDALLGIVMLGVVVTGLLVTLISLYGNHVEATRADRASSMLAETNEALRSIRGRDFTLLTPGTYGLVYSLPGGWSLTGSPDTTGGITRQVQITQVSEHVRLLASTVTWDGGTKTRTSSMYLTNWKKLFEQAPHLLFLVDDNELISDGRGNSEIHGLLLGNAKNSPLVVDKIEITWDKPMHELKEIIVAGTKIWSRDGPGTPTGLQATPALVDVVDMIIPAQGTVLVDKFVFTGNVNNVDVSIRFIMGDGSEKTGFFHSQQG